MNGDHGNPRLLVQWPAGQVAALAGLEEGGAFPIVAYTLLQKKLAVFGKLHKTLKFEHDGRRKMKHLNFERNDRRNEKMPNESQAKRPRAPALN